jgi:hypothetical protein
MNKNVLSLSLLLCLLTKLGAQNSSIQIMDLTPMTMRTATSAGQIDTMNLTEHIAFKLSPIAQADSAYIAVGTTAGASDVMLLKCRFLQNGSQYVLQYSGQQFPCTTYEAYVEVPFSPAQHRKAQFIQLYVKDKSHLATTILNSAFY